MKALARSLYYVAISPQTFVIIVVLFLVMARPDWVMSLSGAISDIHDAAKYVAFVPVAIFAWCWKNGQGILFPPEDIRGIILEWPRFPELKARVFIGLLFQVLFAISSVIAWFMSPSLAHPYSMIVVAGAIVGGAIGAWTFYMAAIATREITKRAGT